MGFVTLGIFTFNKQGLEGSIFQMLSHGLVSAALFLSVGVLYDRLHSRMIKDYGGVVKVLPKYSFLLMVFVLGAVGLPGTSGFVGEFLVLIGTFKVNYLAAILASSGVILSAAYMLWLYKRVILGNVKNENINQLKDLNLSEGVFLFSLALIVIFLGFFPSFLFDTMSNSVNLVINNYQKDLLFHLIQK